MTCKAVIQEEHVQKRFVKFNTLYTHCPWYCHNSGNITQRQAWHIEHEFDNFKEYTVRSSASPHRSTVMRKIRDLSESHFHLWIKTPLSCITSSLVMIHGAPSTIPRPSLSWLGENHHHTNGKLNVYRKVIFLNQSHYRPGVAQRVPGN